MVMNCIGFGDDKKVVYVNLLLGLYTRGMIQFKKDNFVDNVRTAPTSIALRENAPQKLCEHRTSRRNATSLNFEHRAYLYLNTTSHQTTGGK